MSTAREATFIAERFIHLIGQTAPVALLWVLPAPLLFLLLSARLLDQPTLYQCRLWSLDLTKTHPCCRLPALQSTTSMLPLATPESAAVIYLLGVGCVRVVCIYGLLTANRE